MIFSWLDLIFQFGLVVDAIQLSSLQWPVYKKLYPVWPALVTLPALYRLGIGVLLLPPCLPKLPSTTYHSATRVQRPAVPQPRPQIIAILNERIYIFA